MGGLGDVLELRHGSEDAFTRLVTRRLRWRVGAPLIALTCLVAACGASARPGAMGGVTRTFHHGTTPMSTLNTGDFARMGAARVGLLRIITGGVPKTFYGTVPLGPTDSGDFARMGAARVGSLRISVLWPIIQGTRNGPFDWTSTDPVVAGAASHHISLLPTLFGTPNFVSPGLANGAQIKIGTQTQRSEWKSFVRAAVQRYGPHGAFWKLHPELPKDPVKRWQIWNEQNNPNEKNPATVYAKLLKLSDQAVSSVDPHAEVITGGMFGSPPHNRHKKGVTAWSYLDILLKHGAGKHLNGVALHPYAENIAALKAPIEKTRGVLKRHHRGSMKLLITEIGWGSSKKVHPGTGSRGAVFNVGLKKQKENLTKSFKVLTKHRRSWKIGGVFWFAWKDPPQTPVRLCAFCYSSGLYEANGTTAKPALKAYKRFTKRTR